MRSPGQSMTEYVVIGALVCVMAVGSMLLMGGTVTNIFEKMFSSSSGNPGQSGIQTTALNSTSSSTVAGTQSLSITLSSGKQINLSNYPSDLSTAIQVSGGNGTTELLLANLDTVIRHLQATENLTSEQASLLIQLSSQGHHMADMLKQAETIASTTGDTSAIYSLTGPLSPTCDCAEGQAIILQDLYDQAAASGALADPVANRLVSTLTGQILAIGQAAGWTTSDFKSTGTPLNYADLQSSMSSKLAEWGWDENSSESVLALGASVVVHEDSSGICTMGSGTDSGTDCTAATP
jgi:Flp pilus assembly pilin Flp